MQVADGDFRSPYREIVAVVVVIPEDRKSTPSKIVCKPQSQSSKSPCAPFHVVTHVYDTIIDNDFAISMFLEMQFHPDCRESHDA